MARNKISDLNDHLFAQLERLNDESISPEEMKNEVEKAKAIEVLQNRSSTRTSYIWTGISFYWMLMRKEQ